MRRLVALASAVVLCLAHVAHAQTAIPSAHYTWRSVKVGGGGFVPGIVFSPVEKGLVYLRSDMGGAYRWDASAARWLPLQDGMAESSFQGIESLAPDPVDPDVVYLAAGMYRHDPAAILRSADRGRTWQVHPVAFRMGGNEDGRGVGERLAVDPNATAVLYFASRHDGLQRSRDKGETWRQVASFPAGREQKPAVSGGAGLSFVVFDPASGAPGRGSQIIFVGSTVPGAPHLWVSRDGGGAWSAVPGGPSPSLLPVKAQIDGRGILYVAYCNGVGPNGVTDGAVWRLDTRTGAWSDITPDRGANRPPGGYMGLSLDRRHPGTLAVATLNRWSPGDTVWRSTDDGASWRNIDDSRRDVASVPWLKWGEPQPSLGWWMAALAVDPFDSDHAAYATGATIYETRDFTDTGRRRTRWRAWVDGVEQTAVITLASPAQGAHLLSGFGDIGGFVHVDLDTPPEAMFSHPIFDDTDQLGVAALRPAVVVRSGRPHHPGEADLAVSSNGGGSWASLRPPLPPAARRRWRHVAVSADGSVILAGNGPMVRSEDGGRTWSVVRALPDGLRPVADAADPRRFYAVDFAKRRLFTSRDGGVSFAAASAAGLSDISGDAPRSSEAASPLQSTPGRAGDLWLVSANGLFHSTDAGASFSRVDGGVQVELLAFGKAAPGREPPTLFAIGRRDDLRAVWRSDDEGRSWLRVNDDDHEWGRRFRCIAGDPRVFGRVYVGTDGRGILYGDPSP